MNALPGYVTTSLQAICPVDGVGFTSLTDPTTWRIDFNPSATAAQKQAAQVWVAAFNPTVWTNAQVAQANVPLITASYNASLQRQAAKLAAKGKTAQATALYLQAAGVLP